MSTRYEPYLLDARRCSAANIGSCGLQLELKVRLVLEAGSELDQLHLKIDEEAGVSSSASAALIKSKKGISDANADALSAITHSSSSVVADGVNGSFGRAHIPAPSADTIDAAGNVLKAGMNLFYNNSLMHLQMARFYWVYRSNPHKMANALKAAYGVKPLPDVGMPYRL